MNKKELIRRLLAVALAITVGATFIPLLGGSVYAEEEDANEVSVDAAAGDPPADPGSAISIEPEEQTVTE